MLDIILLCVIIALLIYIIATKNKTDIANDLKELKDDISKATQDNIKNLGDSISSNQRLLNEAITEKVNILDKNIGDKQERFEKVISNSIAQQEDRFKTFSTENEQKLENIRTTVEKKLTALQEDNNQKLDKMREVVDEKLQKTLEDRMTKSFQLVNERLEQVYKGLGEMQNLATGVGDLKKVLTNVKSRGILGEIQLGAILEEILAPEQYDTNVAVKKGSRDVVEFAIKIPTEDESTLYLPIDSKFPADRYSALLDAYESGVKENVDTAVKALISIIKSEAKDIRDKYIDPPNTTEFAIMFLPFEGLYAEVVNRGMVEQLQRAYKVNIAGPSTMAALLNSLQMGFKTFAIQKRSSEVWTVLGAVKTEFDKFSTCLENTQKRLEQANNELDKLVGTRTRMIRSKLKNVTSLTDSQAKKVLEDTVVDEE